MSAGYLDAEGIWRYGEDDDEGTWSATLDLAQAATSAALVVDRTRMDGIDTSLGLKAPLTSLGSKRIIPTIASTGGTAAVDSTTGEVTASGALTQLKITVPSASSYMQIRGRLQYIAGGSGSHTTKLAAAGTAEATASSYRGYGVIAVTGAALTPGTSWSQGYTGNRLERVRNFTIDNLAAALKTTWVEYGGDTDAAANELTVAALFRHTVSTALDGWIYDFTSLGTFVELSLILEGV